MRISHETIYRSLFIQTRGVLKKELTRHLRSRRTMRRAKRASTEGQPRGQIIDGISIPLMIALFRGTGKGIYCRDRTTPIWPPWWNGSPGLRSSSKSREKIRAVW
jgi:hypothetical protein